MLAKLLLSVALVFGFTSMANPSDDTKTRPMCCKKMMACCGKAKPCCGQ